MYQEIEKKINKINLYFKINLLFIFNLRYSEILDVINRKKIVKQNIRSYDIHIYIYIYYVRILNKGWQCYN